MTTTVESAYTGPVTANGTTPIPFTFQAIDASQIAVYRNGVKFTTGFTVALNGDNTGTITPTSSWGTDQVYVISDPDYGQGANFSRFAGWYPDQLNDPLDRLAKQIIAIRAELERSFKAPFGYSGPVLGVDALTIGSLDFADPRDYGVVMNDAAAADNNVTAWNACRANERAIRMPHGSMWMSDSWRADAAYQTIVFPQRSAGYTDLTGTRILSTNKTKDAMVIGPDLQPATVADFPRGLTVINPCAGWGVALDPLSGLDQNLRKAIRMNYLIDALIEYPWAHEGPIGCWYYGLVGSRVVRPKAFRSAAFGGTDKFIGHWFRGSPAILAGGNASLVVEHAAVEMSSALALSDEIGMLHDGSISDVHVSKLETSGVKNGVRVTGTGAGGSLASNINFELDDLVMDTVHGIGVEVSAVAPGGAVNIKRINVMSAVGATHGVKAYNNYGHVHVGGVVHGKGASAAGTFIGLRVENSPNFTCDLMLVDCPKPFEGDTVSLFNIKLDIDNPTVIAAQAAVYFATLTRGCLDVRINGGNNYFPQGVFALGSASNNVTFRGMEQINPAAISGGAANKLQINSVQITAPGQYTNLGAANAAGTMSVIGSMA